MRLSDLLKMPKAIGQHLEQRSEERGQQLANSLIESTSQGRGLWVFLLLPAWFMVFAATAAILQTYMRLPLMLGAVVGVVFSVLWWKHTFTRCHPFFSSCAALFGLPILVIFAGK